MKMKLRLITLWMIGLALLAAGSAAAQTRNDAKLPRTSTDTDDFQFRTGFALHKQFAGRLTAIWDEELRTKSNASEMDRIYSTLGMKCQITPYLQAGASYTFMAICKGSGNPWERRHRAQADLILSCRVAEVWKLSLRERVRATFLEGRPDPQKAVDPAWVMRTRAMVERKFNSVPLKPYLYTELSHTLNTPPLIDNYVDKFRLSCGMKYPVTRRSEFDLYYRFDRTWHRSANPTDGLLIAKARNHIIGLFYALNF